MEGSRNRQQAETLRKHQLSFNMQNIHLLKSDMSTLVYHGYINEEELIGETTQAPSPTSLVTLIPDSRAKFTVVNLIITKGNRKHPAVERQPPEIMCSCLLLHCGMGKYARKANFESSTEQNLLCSHLMSSFSSWKSFIFYEYTIPRLRSHNTGEGLRILP